MPAIPSNQRQLILSRRAWRLIALTPRDGSMDLYASAMLGIPQARVPELRARLARRATLIDRSGHEAS